MKTPIFVIPGEPVGWLAHSELLVRSDVPRGLYPPLFWLRPCDVVAEAGVILKIVRETQVEGATLGVDPVFYLLVVWGDTYEVADLRNGHRVLVVLKGGNVVAVVAEQKGSTCAFRT